MPVEVDEEALLGTDVRNESPEASRPRNSSAGDNDSKDKYIGHDESFIRVTNEIEKIEKELGIGTYTAAVSASANSTRPSVKVQTEVGATGVTKEIEKIEKELGISMDTAAASDMEIPSHNIFEMGGNDKDHEVDMFWTGTPSVSNGQGKGDTMNLSTTKSAFDNSDDVMSRLKLLEEMVLHNPENAEISNKQIEEDEKYPQDTYTLMALNGPVNMKWPQEKMLSFCFGLMVFGFQMVLLLLLMFGQTLSKFGTVEDNGNPSEDSFLARIMPPNAKAIVIATQIVSLLAYVVFPESSVQDMVTAIQFFPVSPKDKDDSTFYLRFACILKFIQGCCATLTVWILVMTSTSVVDVILNFTAVNFVSNFDDTGFCLAESGVFGKMLRKGVKRIADARLPTSVRKQSKHVWYWYWIVMASILVVYFAVMIYVLVSQRSNDRWITQILRVEFNDKEFQKFSGCYKMNEGLRYYRRYTYSSYKQGSNTSIGYCLENRQWMLFDGNNDWVDPCDAKTQHSDIAHSSKTDTFDISTSFEERWVSSSGTPLDLFFFEGDKEDELHCDLFLGDGICNEEFNDLGKKYDQGDCCSPTCEGPKCGKGVLPSVFGDFNGSGTGFPNCKNPNMIPITIQLNGMTSNRKSVDTTGWFWSLSNESQWRTETPVDTYFAIDCNDKSVLTAYIKDSMINKSQTVYVEDGSSCKLVVKNTTGKIIFLADTFLANVSEWKWNGTDALSSEPIWYTNYSIFQQTTNETGNDKIEVLSQQSSQKGNENFKLLPHCFLKELQNHIDTTSIYKTALGPSEEAVNWLVKDNPKISQCGEVDFLQRYALVGMNFAMSPKEPFITREHHCRWPYIICSSTGYVNDITIVGEGLKGEIPSTISLLRDLKNLNLSYNKIIASIPTEIGLLLSLQKLDLTGNLITSIPGEIGLLTNLDKLHFWGNSLSSIPSEIGLLTNLDTLLFDDNQLTSIPTEIGLLTNLDSLSLYDNQLTSIPTEIGLLTNLDSLLTFYFNLLTSIPSEIGLLTNLDKLHLANNLLTSIPTEIGLLTNLDSLSLSNNPLTSIPTEIGLLTNLDMLWISNNLLTSIPTEIGLLTNLDTLWISQNPLTSIPTEIGLLTRLERLGLRGNGITCDELPEEVLAICDDTRPLP